MIISAAERFWRKVEPTGFCWLWTGATSKGYGSFWSGERGVKAHRFAYELLVGPVPEGLQLDHLCRVRHCVNPDHLEPVTAKENFRRIPRAPATPKPKKRVPGFCRNGHPRPTGERCSECGRVNSLAYYHRQQLAKINAT